MATPSIRDTLKATGKSLIGVNGLMLGLGAIGDYSARRQQGDSVGSAAFKTTVTNVLPSILLSGPKGMVYSALIYGLPMLPALAQNVAATSTARETYIRHSALPFSHYGSAPTMGAIQAMQRVSEQSSTMRGLSQAHAALAAQAFRR